MKLRWTKGRRGGVRGSPAWKHLMFWDLIDDDDEGDLYPEGVTIGWVRRMRCEDEDGVSEYLYEPLLNARPSSVLPAHYTLKAAQDALVAYAIAQQLEEMP